MNIVPLTKICLAVLGLVLFASCGEKRIIVGQDVPSLTWGSNEYYQACLDRIPSEATEGQKMIARHTCRRDAEVRVPITIFVQDAVTGRPIQKAEVSIHNAGKTMKLATDEKGKAKNNFKKGESIITIRAKGFKSIEKNINFSSRKKLDFRLVRTSGSLSPEGGGVAGGGCPEGPPCPSL